MQISGKALSPSSNEVIKFSTKCIIFAKTGAHYKSPKSTESSVHGKSWGMIVGQSESVLPRGKFYDRHIFITFTINSTRNLLF